MAYLEFDGGTYTQFWKNLLEHKGSDLQKEFLKAARDSKFFIQWIERDINCGNKGGEIDLLSDKLSEAEYKFPPRNVETKLFKMWEGLTPVQASRETFWGYVTLKHIKQGIIESHYLAIDVRSHLSGIEQINRALIDSQEKQIDIVVRNILRNLSGLPQRGTRSVYVDCRFARAWWRVFIAHQVHGEVDVADLNTTLGGASKGHWGPLIDLIVSRYSILGDTKVRSALIWALSEQEEAKKSEVIKRIVKQIGIQSAWQELGVFDVGELKEQVMKPIISKALETEQKAKERKTQDKAEAKRNETQEPKPKSKPKRSKRFWRRS